jgi:hypothetical protein
MKRTLLIAAIVGLSLVTTLDLQARQRRHVLPRPVRAGIAVALLSHAPLVIHHNRQARYQHYQGRQIAAEIRGNERRIWQLEERIDMLDRYEGNYREIRRLEQEINWLERRNHYLRQRYY